MNIEIANRLVERRRAAGYSQEALAAALGVSRQAVSKWERGESAPDTDNLIALARLYGVSLDELIFDAAAGGAGEQTAPAGSEESAAGERPAAGGRGELRRRMARFPYPVAATAVYLLLGFLGGWWHPGWLVFLTIPLYYGIAGDDDEEESRA